MSRLTTTNPTQAERRFARPVVTGFTPPAVAEISVAAASGKDSALRCPLLRINARRGARAERHGRRDEHPPR